MRIASKQPRMSLTFSTERLHMRLQLRPRVCSQVGAYTVTEAYVRLVIVGRTVVL